MTDKRCTEDEAVATLADGMTIGFGGWASRRKPMSIVRAILRSNLTDLTVVTYGGPDAGLLCAAGRVQEGPLCLVRDPLEVLTAYEQGVENVVAFLTDGISAQQLEMLAALMDEKKCESVELY